MGKGKLPCEHSAYATLFYVKMRLYYSSVYHQGAYMKTMAQQRVSAGVLPCVGIFVDSSQTHTFRCLNLNRAKIG